MNSKKRKNLSAYLKKRNVKRFGLFIIIAFVFLIFSKLSNDYKQTIRLKISIANIEDEIILLNDSLNTIDALVEAKGFTLIPFVFTNYKAIVLDAQTDIKKDAQQFVFDVQKHRYLIEGQLGSSYKVLTIKPDTLELPYSKRASKYVPIDLKANINFTSGFDIRDNYILSEDSVKVVGALKDINQINSIATKELNLKQVNKNIEENVSLVIPNDIEVFPKSVIVSAEVERFTEGTLEVPITIVNKPNNITINYFPKTVTISYYVDLDNYNKVTVSDFSIECDYKNIEDNQTYLTPRIVEKPEFTKRVSMKQNRIDFIKL